MKIEQTVQQAQQGEKKAMNTVIAYLYEKVPKFMKAKNTLSYETKKDITQDIVLKVYQKLHQFNPNLGLFDAWLSRIVRNDCLKELHNQKNMDSLFKQNKESGDFWVFLYDESDFTDNQIKKNEDELEMSVKALQVKKQIDYLKKGQKTVMQLRLEGYSHDEIASLMEISVSTSKTQYKRAIERISQTVAL